MNKFKKINLYNRQYSLNRINQDRPVWYDKEKVFANLLGTINFDLCNLTVIFEREIDYQDSFIRKYEKIKPFVVKFIDTTRDKWIGRTNEDIAWSRSIAAASEVIWNDNLKDDELVAIADEDYLHRLNWGEATLDFYNNHLDDNEAICLADNYDKYLFTQKPGTIDQYGTDHSMYFDLKSKIRYSSYGWWRTVPNFMTSSIWPVKLWKRDFDPFWKKGFSDCDINNLVGKQHGTVFWTSLPGYSCHTVHPFMSPGINWEFCMNNMSVYKEINP